MRNCSNCGHCRCRVVLIPGLTQFRHRNPDLQAFLNRELQFAEVWCEESMWITQNGEEFVYTSLDRLPNESPRLLMANSCPHYED